MTAPILDDHLGFQPITEPFHRQASIPELTIEAFIGAVLPGFSGLNQGSSQKTENKAR